MVNVINVVNVGNVVNVANVANADNVYLRRFLRLFVIPMKEGSRENIGPHDAGPFLRQGDKHEYNQIGTKIMNKHIKHIKHIDHISNTGSCVYLPSRGNEGSRNNIDTHDAGPFLRQGDKHEYNQIGTKIINKHIKHIRHIDHISNTGSRVYLSRGNEGSRNNIDTHNAGPFLRQGDKHEYNQIGTKIMNKHIMHIKHIKHI
ncbi:hypothetical protein DN068_16700 [Taibaiella soli]|uniref:Uncharacterized protein n=1 Tax=Taibaiella soli TaxID=1649169 RepID=A0A2W2B6S7_9BACT|nr:hypothetical protein DN068_16700 [Taibaiella soli]